ncbi:MAG: GNAT family N-acetyltransferase [Candidatus Heimdallarchaeota archaeon]|nr:GNAT family N-acetyltransferase [Candidatus Heimdallarchaeota archaeon]
MEFEQPSRFFTRKMTEDDFPRVKQLLLAEKLPLDDLENHTKHILVLVSFNTNEILGCVAIEKYEEIGLLRSMVVEKGFQGKGLGTIMQQDIENYARDINLSTLYLFTNTAESFFSARGYDKITREDGDDRLKQSKEFIICNSATFMRKLLD